MGISSSIKCKYCGGGGMVHPLVNGVVDYGQVITCSCRQDEVEGNRRKALLKYCELPPMVDSMTFQNFKVYKEVKALYEAALNVSKNPKSLHWITFMGQNDVGKTHLCVAICKVWIEQGVAAKYIFVPLLLDELREGFKGEGENNYNERFKRYCNVPLLVLDDLGAEARTPWVLEKLETLVDYRYMNNLSLVVAMNKTIDELSVYSSRLASRLVRHPNTILATANPEEPYTMRRTKGIK